MIVFTIKFIEDVPRDFVRVEYDFGDPAEGSEQENDRALIIKKILCLAARILPAVTACAAGSSVEEARQKVEIQEDIRWAGQ